MGYYHLTFVNTNGSLFAICFQSSHMLIFTACLLFKILPMLCPARPLPTSSALNPIQAALQLHVSSICRGSFNASRYPEHHVEL